MDEKTRLADWRIEEMTGYKPKTTFYTDFSIAERFGVAAVRETAGTAFREWKGNTEYLTELCMALNWKIWEHYESNPQLAEVYNDLWATVNDYCMDNLKGDDLRYFLSVTD